MDKPILYRYKFDEDSGSLESESVEDYSEVMWFGKKEFRYKLFGTLRIVKESNLDKYIYGQVHSFDSDEEHAKQVIRNLLKAKYTKAYDEAQKYKQILEKMS